MRSWLDVQSTVLDEIITLDGPGNIQIGLCSTCLDHESTPLYHCLECLHGSLVCGECVVKLHHLLPLHRLEVCLFLSLTRCFHHIHIVCSAGQVGFSTKLLYIPSGSSVILGTEVLPAPSSHNLMIYSLLT